MRSVRGHARQYQPLTRKKPDRVGVHGGVGFALSVSYSPNNEPSFSTTHDNPNDDEAGAIGLLGTYFGGPTPPDPPYVANLITKGFASGPGPYLTEPVVLNDRVQFIWYAVLFYSLDNSPSDFSDIGSHPDVGTISWVYTGDVCSGINAATGVCGDMLGTDGTGGTLAPITWNHENVDVGGGCAWIVLGFEGFGALDNYDATSCPDDSFFSWGSSYTAVMTVARMPSTTPARFNEAPWSTHMYSVRGKFRNR